MVHDREDGLDIAEPLGLDELLNIRVQRLASRMTLVTTRQILRNTGVTIGEWRVITRLVENGPLKLAELSRMLGLDPGPMSRLMKAAELKGIVSRTENPRDGRSSLFHLTDFSRQVFVETWPKAQSVIEEFHQLYTAEELELLNAFLERAIGRANEKLELEA